MPFLDVRWNDRNVFMTYNHLQSHPSPLGMRVYETVNPSSPMFGTDLFINHKDLDVPDSPCFSGERVRHYENIINLQKYICNLSRAFSHLFECCEVGIDANRIAKFNNYCSSKDLRDFFSAV